jgi:hypothetical protein
MTIEFRLLAAGDPAGPVRVFPIWEEDGEVVLLEGEFTERLPVRSLADVSLNDLPEWLTRQDLPLFLGPAKVAEGCDTVAAVVAVYQAANEVYERGVSPEEISEGREATPVAASARRA